jgi:DNA-binding NarL/FixJ family response regulator
MGSIPQQSGTLRVLLVDDQESVRNGLRLMLGTQSSFALCGEACNGLQALQMSRELHPEIIVMDISMPVLNGLEATREILKACPDVEILIFSQHDSSQAARAAKEAGARGFLAKSEAGKFLLPALSSMASHKPFFPFHN